MSPAMILEIESGWMYGAISREAEALHFRQEDNDRDE
jgi:hypothetical protein